MKRGRQHLLLYARIGQIGASGQHVIALGVKLKLLAELDTERT